MRVGIGYDSHRFDPERPLINYEDPGKSLIIQYGLPRADAQYPHPPTKGWKPAFGRTTTRVLEDTVDWIDAMMRPRPVYPFDFDPEATVEEAADDGGPLFVDPDRAPR